MHITIHYKMINDDKYSILSPYSVVFILSNAMIIRQICNADSTH